MENRFGGRQIDVLAVCRDPRFYLHILIRFDNYDMCCEVEIELYIKISEFSVIKKIGLVGLDRTRISES